MKTKDQEQIIYGKSIDVIELKSVKVMHGSCLVREYGTLNFLPQNIHHMIKEAFYRVEEFIDMILL